MKIKKKSKYSEKFQVKENQKEVFDLEKHIIKHYSSSQKILLVGEGDFSFALCLATAFGSARNMVATSLDSREELIKYSKAMSNLRELEDRGCILLHGVDVHTMLHHPLLIKIQFDRIIFNFPHAGYSNGPRSSEKKKSQIWLHQNLVMGYLKSSREMLSRGGEIHVTHKTSYPFSEWEIVKLAEEVGLFLVQEARKVLTSHYRSIQVIRTREELGFVIKLFLLESLEPSDLPSSCTLPPLPVSTGTAVF